MVNGAVADEGFAWQGEGINTKNFSMGRSKFVHTAYVVLADRNITTQEFLLAAGSISESIFRRN